MGMGTGLLLSTKPLMVDHYVTTEHFSRIQPSPPTSTPTPKFSEAHGSTWRAMGSGLLEIGRKLRLGGVV